MCKDLPRNEILEGDCREVMAKLPMNSVDMVMFSPPYWGLRDYGEEVESIWGGDKDCEHKWEEGEAKEIDMTTGSNGIKRPRNKKASTDERSSSDFCVKCGAWRGQFGLEADYRMYVSHLVEIFEHIKRVLKPSGSCYLNLGDTYSTKNGGAEQLKKNGDKTPQYGEDIPSKCKLLMPYRVALALIDDGWICRNDIVWCLDSETNMFAKVDGQYWRGKLKNLLKKDGKILLPTSKKGETVWTKLLGSRKSKTHKGLKFTLTNGMTITVTKEHKFPVKKTTLYSDEPSYLKISEEKAKNIEEGDFLYVAKDFSIDEENKEYSYDEGMGIGLFLAEGTYLRRKLYNKGGKYSEAALKRWADEKGYDSINEYLNNRDDKRGLQISHSDKNFLDKLPFKINKYEGSTNRSCDSYYFSLVEKFVEGSDAYTKHLSDEAWDTNKKFLRGIIDGYLQGDGHYDEENDRWRLDFTAENEHLMSDLVVLSRILGYDIRLQNKNDVYQSAQIKKNWDNRNCFKDLFVQRIKEKEEVDDCEFYDLSVKPIFGTYCDNSNSIIETTNDRLKKWNHLYYIGNGILTHNSKPNPMPHSVKDRLNTTTERIFHFVQQKKYYYDLDAIRRPCKNRVEDKTCTLGVSKRYDEDDKCLDEDRGDSTTHLDGKNPGDVFEINTKPFPEAHFAVYPPSLCKKPIKSSCPPKVCAKCGKPYERQVERKKIKRERKTPKTQPTEDRPPSPNDYAGTSVEFKGWEKTCSCDSDETKSGVVLDPMCGAGSTLKMAQELGRDFLGIEINPNYIDIAKDRLKLNNKKLDEFK